MEEQILVVRVAMELVNQRPHHLLVLHVVVAVAPLVVTILLLHVLDVRLLVLIHAKHKPLKVVQIVHHSVLDHVTQLAIQVVVDNAIGLAAVLANNNARVIV